MLALYIFFTLFFCMVSSDNAIVYRFCVNQLTSNGRACSAIQKGNSLVACVPVTDSADCALKIQRNEADFGIFTAEEALLASQFIDKDVRVVGQLRHKDRITESFAFQTVVVVRENFNGGLLGLQSMNYCHLGFGEGQVWSDRVLKEFEKAAISRSCHEEYPNAHQEVFSIANFFKSACRPGQWAMDDLVDKKLKKKFPSLCALCDMPNRCSYDDESQGSHIAALNCLVKNGDVTYVALQHVKEYFGMIPGFIAKNNNTSEFKFLCPDGTSQPLEQNPPCAWIKQPWPSVIAAKDKYPKLNSLLPTFTCYGAGCRGTWKEAFTVLLEGTSMKFLTNSYGERTLSDLIREGRSIPHEWERGACNKTVRWCTISADENEKCEWLRKAVISQDFEPRLSCVPSNNMWSCFDLIRKKQADIIGIDTNYAFIAEKVFNLSAVMYQDNGYDAHYIIVAVVRSDTEDIKSFADLKGKKACFPEYNGLAWNSFLNAAKNHKSFPMICPKIKAVSQFFKDLCVPGVFDNDHKDYGNITASAMSNICSLCTKKNNNSKEECEANYNNQYYGDYGAFSCLMGNSSSNANADVAFVDYRRLFSKGNDELLRTITKTDYRILCSNGTLIQIPENDAELDEKCAFSTGIRGQIISRKYNSKYETRDIADLLLKMDDKFGEVIFGYDNVIQMYGPFKGKKGLLLKDTTVDFVTITDQNNHMVNYFTELKASVFEECHENKKSDSRIIEFNFTFLLFLLIASFMNYFRFTVY